MVSTSTRTFRVTGIDITGYLVKDTARALAFYRDVFGLEPTKLYPDSGGAEYELADGATFGLYNPEGEFPFRPGTGVMLAVDDFPAAVSHAKAQGVPVYMETESPVCFMAMVEDSEGNHLMIHKRKAL
jgi:predicted enzyme related to lactoylglutathione lyase